MYHAASESHFGSQLDVFFDLTEPKYLCTRQKR